MIPAIIAYLITAVPALKLVGGAADFSKAVETNPRAVPAAYVFISRDSAGPNLLAPDIHQKVSVEIAVVLAVKNISDNKGAAASIDIDAMRKAVKAALLGYVPEAGCDPLERGSGQLLTFRDSHIWWQDNYTTSFYDRSVL